MALVDDIRKVFEEVLLPELRTINAKLDALTDGQQRMADSLLSEQRAMSESCAHAQQELEVRLLYQIEQAQLDVLRSVAADLSVRNEELRKLLKEPASTVH